MANVTTPSLVRQIGSLFEGGSVAGLSDRQLLERFVARRDPAAEDAFAALVARHGPMVLQICRQLLGDRHHAEDTFQAVFLVLARRARSVRDPDLLANWLYGVALRTARKARVRLAHRRDAQPEDVSTCPGPSVSAVELEIDREQADALHAEIDRLPDAFRLPIVLCYLEGLTLDEAARRLRWPAGTLRSRLARARDKLRRGLTRRGIVLPAAALAAVLDAKPASASISSPLCDITTRAAIHYAAGHAASTSTSALAREVLRTMLVHKLKFLALTLLALGAVAGGAGYLALARATHDEPRSPTAGPRTPIAANLADADPKPAPGRMFVVGRVLDPTGKPVPGATIAAYARSLAQGHAPRLSPRTQVPIGDARSDAAGRFRIDASRISSLHHHAFGAVALAPGYGAGWVVLDPDDDRPSADITLRPEQVIHGRLFDVQGRPAPDVTLSVSLIRRVLPQTAAGARNRLDGISYDFTNINDFPAWPRPVVTDTEGRFTLRGIGRDLSATLTVHHPRFALQRIAVETDGTPKSKSITAALLPAQILTGRVTYADTNEGVPHATLVLLAGQSQGIRGVVPAEFEADAEGQFRLNPPPAERSYGLTAYPPQGQPYLSAEKSIEWPKGALEQSVDIALPRGISIRGKVTEAGSGKPVPGASVAYFGRGRRQGGRPSASNSLDTASDGSFHLGAEPIPGGLFIKGPSEDYVLQAIGFRVVDEGQPGGRRIYSHAHALLDLKPGMGSQDVDLVLRRGATVTGRILGPDGRPVHEAWFFSRIILDPNRVAWASWSGRVHGNVRDGHFEVHGLDPEAEVPVCFLDPKGKLGAVVNLSGKSAAGGPVTVRLEPCGAARARLVDAVGKPVAKPLRRGFLAFSMVVTPGPTYSIAKGTAALLADEDNLILVDPVNYPTEPVPDADGRITFSVLIPGATYRVIDYTIPRGTAPAIRKEFAVKPGETIDLGEIRIEKPTA